MQHLLVLVALLHTADAASFCVHARGTARSVPLRTPAKPPQRYAIRLRPALCSLGINDLESAAPAESGADEAPGTDIPISSVDRGTQSRTSLVGPIIFLLAIWSWPWILIKVLKVGVSKARSSPEYGPPLATTRIIVIIARFYKVAQLDVLCIGAAPTLGA